MARELLLYVDMRRATFLIVLCALAGLVIASNGCNEHPLKEIEYEHFTGGSDGTGSAETGTSSSSSGGETGTGSSSSGSEDTGDEDTGTDTGIKFDVGPECGNGIVEPGEQCDLGPDNGPPPSPCSDECFSNAQ